MNKWSSIAKHVFLPQFRPVHFWLNDWLWVHTSNTIKNNRRHWNKMFKSRCMIYDLTKIIEGIGGSKTYVNIYPNFEVSIKIKYLIIRKKHSLQVMLFIFSFESCYMHTTKQRKTHTPHVWKFDNLKLLYIIFLFIIEYLFVWSFSS